MAQLFPFSLGQNHPAWVAVARDKQHVRTNTQLSGGNTTFRTGNTTFGADTKSDTDNTTFSPGNTRFGRGFALQSAFQSFHLSLDRFFCRARTKIEQC